MGKILSISSTVNTGDGVSLWKANPFRYSGYQYDDKTDLYYLKSRYYSPFIGRFITRDVVFALNLYSYAANNLTNFVDPDGFVPIDDKGTPHPEAMAGNGNKSSWLNDTAPPIPFYIPSSNELMSNLSSSTLGTAAGAISEIQRKAKMFINDRGTIEYYPSTSQINIKPFKKLGKSGTIMAIASGILDLANTFSEDNGNTNKKRIIKAGIQGSGMLVSGGVGYLSGRMVGAGIAGVPGSKGLSLALIPLASYLNYKSIEYIGVGQKWLYKNLDIN